VSASAQVRRLRDRPIAERERRTAIAIVVVLIVASAVLLAATRPAGRTRKLAPRRPVASANGASRPPMPADAAASVAPAVARTAHGFLAGYLAYLYGRAPASGLTGTTHVLSRSLRGHPPIVSPGVRARRPRVLSLHATPAPVGLIGLSALINDGELASYRVRLILARERGRLLVTAVEGA
jgi:hypothetical protein